MGLKLKAKEEFKIVVQGTDFELENIYVRTRFSRSLDGKTLEVQGNIYISESKFRENENSIVSIELVDSEGNKTCLPSIGNYGVNVIPENYDNNDLVLSHDLVVRKLSDLLIVSHKH